MRVGCEESLPLSNNDISYGDRLIQIAIVNNKRKLSFRRSRATEKSLSRYRGKYHKDSPGVCPVRKISRHFVPGVGSSVHD